MDGEPVILDATTMVAELARMLMPLAEGEEFVLTFQVAPTDQRILVGTK